MNESPFLSPDEVEGRRILHEAIGRFVVGFELVIAELRGACRLMLERGGLGIKNQPLASIVLSRLGAAELTEATGAMYREFRPDDADGASELGRVLKRVDRLREHRNRIIHSPWVFDVADRENRSDPFAYSITFDRSRTIVQTVREARFRPTDFDSLTTEATTLQVYGIRLCYCINQSGFSLANELRRPV